MTDEDRDNVAQVFRQHALKIEATAFEQASRLNEEIISELVEIAARFTEVAEMLEATEASKKATIATQSKGNDETASEENGVDHDS